MRVFISSLIRGLEPFRDAIAEAVQALGYEVVRSEAFGARPQTPQRACLEEVRKSDLTIVILGNAYGYVQSAGLSATHEEFREARDHSRVAVFVQDGIEPDAQQAEFIREAQDWGSGGLSATFREPDDLRTKVTTMLHRYALGQASGSVDSESLVGRARDALLLDRNRSGPRIHLVVAGGPEAVVVPPAQLDDQTFAKSILQEALFGARPILDPSVGTRTDQGRGRLSLHQEGRGGRLAISEDGTVSVALPARDENRDPRHGLAPMIEEDVEGKLGDALSFAKTVFDEVDPVHRMSHVVVLAAVEGGAYVGWRTREEHAASPNRMSVPMRGNELVVVPDQARPRPRGAISAGATELIRDLLTRLRRELR